MRRHKGSSPRQTRIVATIGLCPEPDYATFLDGMLEAGVDVIRLNMSHAAKGYTKEAEILAWANQPVDNHTAPRVAVLADLQGPKARVGELGEDGLTLVEGAEIQLTTEAGTGTGVVVPLPGEVGPAVIRALRSFMRDQPGTYPRMLFGDGDLVVEITNVSSHSATARVIAGGVLSSRKGITIRGVDIDLDPFPQKDQRDLGFLLSQGIDFLAVSFVRTATDIKRVRRYILENQRPESTPIRLIAKIETLSAIDNIDSIVTAADGIMIARGDLGLQLGVAEVPLAQKTLAHRARQHGKPVIVATQMLESMINNPAPTRAEATDVFNAILDGGDAVMLSGETSVGSRPYAVVETIARLALVAERFRADPMTHRSPRTIMENDSTDTFISRINEEFALTAVHFAERIPAKAVVTFTRSGGTPRRLSRHRSDVPLFAVCQGEAVARSLLLCYGVHPVVMHDFDVDVDGPSRMIKVAREVLRRDYGLTPGDALVITAGVDWPRGGTNSIRVVVEDVDEALGLDRRRRSTGRHRRATIS
ncbi:MAG: pyruvate kinase [Myxococcales bacterium]|nr:pyruvate kinase [Myxococcales bacterium]